MDVWLLASVLHTNMLLCYVMIDLYLHIMKYWGLFRLPSKYCSQHFVKKADPSRESGYISYTMRKQSTNASVPTFTVNISWHSRLLFSLNWIHISDVLSANAFISFNISRSLINEYWFYYRVMIDTFCNFWLLATLAVSTIHMHALTHWTQKKHFLSIIQVLGSCVRTTYTFNDEFVLRIVLSSSF